MSAVGTEIRIENHGAIEVRGCGLRPLRWARYESLPGARYHRIPSKPLSVLDASVAEPRVVFNIFGATRIKAGGIEAYSRTASEISNSPVTVR